MSWIPASFGQSQRYQSLFENETLSDVLHHFSKQTGIRLVYVTSLTDTIHITAKIDAPPISAMKQILLGTRLDFLRHNSDLWIFVPRKETRQLPAEIIGHIFDASSKKPIYRASISLQKTPHGCNSDRDGRFHLTAIKPGVYTLHVQRIGYTSIEQEVHLSGNSYHRRDFNLQPAPLSGPEIGIESEREPISQRIRLSQQRITSRQMAIPPLLNDGDAFAIVHNMPGISGRDPDDIFPHIEGGSAAEMGVEVDGIPIFVPTYGRNHRSLFTMHMLENIDILRAGYDATHGEALSGVISMQTAELNASRPRLQTRIHTQGFSLGGQVALKKIAWIGFARHLNLHYDDSGTNNQVDDFSQKLSLKLNQNHSFKFLLFTGHGVFTQSNSTRPPAQFNINTGLTYTYRKHLDVLFYSTSLQNTAHETGMKLQWQANLHPDLNWRCGLHVFHLNASGDALTDSVSQYKIITLPFLEYNRLSQDLFDQDLKLAVLFNQMTVQKKHWDFTAGIRLPLNSQTHHAYIAPRLSFSYAPLVRWRFTFSAGKYLQFADRSYASEAKSGDAPGFGEYVAIVDNDQPATAHHLRFESTLKLPLGWVLAGSVFHKAYRFQSHVYHTRLNDISWLIPLQKGHSHGIQLIAHKMIGPVQGWLNVTRSATTYYSAAGTAFNPYFHRKSIVQLAFSNYVSAELQLRVHYAQYSGYPERLWGPENMKLSPLLSAEEFATNYLTDNPLTGSRTRIAFGMTWKCLGARAPHAIDFTLENSIADQDHEIENTFRFWAGYRFMLQ